MPYSNQLQVIHVQQTMSNTIAVHRGSALGNPFVMQGEAERDEVCDKYRKWFYDHVDVENWLTTATPNPQEALLRTIYERSLTVAGCTISCYCHPKRCHADTIKEFIDYQIELLFK